MSFLANVGSSVFSGGGWVFPHFDQNIEKMNSESRALTCLQGSGPSSQDTEIPHFHLCEKEKVVLSFLQAWKDIWLEHIESDGC